MAFKTKKGAINRLQQYSRFGVVFQYKKSGRWDWGTMESPNARDLRNGGFILNPTSKYCSVEVQNIDWIH